MARSLAWHAAFYSAAFLAGILDECAMNAIDFAMISGRVTMPTSCLLNTMRAVVVVLLGLLYDVKGPRACFLVNMLLYLAALLPLSLGSNRVLPYFPFGQPGFGLPLLGARGCSAEERATMVGRLIFVILLGKTFFDMTKWKVLAAGAFMDYLILAPLLLGLQFYLSRGSDKADGDDSMLPAPAPTSIASLPKKIVAASRPLKRPEVLAAFVINLVTPSRNVIESFIVLKAATDEKQDRLTGLDIQHVGLSSALLTLPLILASGATARRLGPQRMLMSTLQVLVAVNIMILALFWLPLPVPLVHRCLPLDFVVAFVATAVLQIVSLNFVLGVVEASERGTVSSLLYIGDNGRHIPIPLWDIAEKLYSLGGVSLPMVLILLTNFGLLLFFKRSPLMHLHLKEG